MNYEPPFKITAKSINLISEISAVVERVKINSEKSEFLKLRKVNRMKTIRGSLAIEGNSLTEEQVTALIDGKHIVAPVKEVQEVRNAIKVYENFDSFNNISLNCSCVIPSPLILLPFKLMSTRNSFTEFN